MKIILLITAILTLSACASINNGTTQQLSVRLVDDLGKNSTCNAKNEEGSFNILPGQANIIDRDGNDMIIECRNETQSGLVTVSPTFDTSFLLLDFIGLDACIFSCVIDGINNSFYSYPSLISIPMIDNKGK